MLLQLLKPVTFRCLGLIFGIIGNAQVNWQEYPHPINDTQREEIRFGYLTVPETRSDFSNRNLQIGFCVLKSKSGSPLKDAILYLPGGPGQGYTHAASFFLEGESIMRLLQKRDIVLFDPRGCGTSDPQLCPGLEDPEIINADLKGITIEAYWQGIARAMKACADSLSITGLDPDAYGSSDIADDVEDLRIALGYDKWNIRGHSYGSRFAQSVLRQYPGSVRSAILSGVVPAAWAYEERDFYGFVHALRKVVDQCAADPKCSEAYPDLAKQLVAVLQRLREEPIILPPGTFALLPDSPIVINPKMVLQGMFQALYIREGFEMLPIMISTAAKGHDWIAEALTIALSIDFQIDGDMYHAIRCNDCPGYRHAPGPVITDTLVPMLYPFWQGNYHGTEAELCLNLQIPIDSAEQEAVHSDVPMIIYSGEFDPVTPPYYADSIARYLPNATTFVVRGRGHDAPVPMSELMADFIIDPEKKPDLGMLDRLPPPEFLVDVHLNKGISALSIKMAKMDYGALPVILGTVAAMILLTFLYFTYLVGRSLYKRDEVGSFLPIWLPTFMGTLFLALFAIAMQDAMSRHLYLLVFGLPDNWSFLLYLPWLLLIALIGSITGGKSFLRQHKKVTTRLFWAMALTGNAALIIWLLLWEII